jgi:hypothetical protein
MVFKINLKIDSIKGKTDVFQRFKFYKIYASLLHNDS